MRNLFLSVTTIFAISATTLLTTQTSSAQSAPEPAVVISMAPLGEQLDDMKHLVEASGFGNLNFMIQSQAKYYTGGIDREKASGAFLFFEGDNPKPKWLAMIAVDDPDKVLDQVANFADVDEGDDFIVITPDSGEEILIKESDGYFLISDDGEMFDRAPESPGDDLMAFAGDQNLVLRVFGQRVPQALRDEAIEKIDEGFTEQMEALDNIDETVIEAQMAQLKSLINETDEVMLSYKIDKETKLLTSKFALTALEGSEIAKRVAVLNSPGESAFTGFLNDDSALDFNLRYQLHEDDVNLYNGLLDNMQQQMIEELDNDGEFTDEELVTIESASSKIVDSLKATFEGKLIDSGGVLMMDKDTFHFVAGSTMAETEKLEEAVKSLVDLADKKADDVLEAKLNSGTYGDITLHTMVFRVPEDEEEARKAFGSRVEVIIGVSPDKFYVAVGQDPLTTLTAAIDRSKNPTPSKYGQLVYNIHIAPILRYASGVTGEEALAGMAQTLEDNKTGRITLWSKPIPNGIETSIEVQDGILALIKEGFDAYQQGAFQDDGDMDEF